MKILLPLFLAGTEPDWTIPPLADLLRQRLATVCELASAANVRVFTDSGHVSKQAASVGISVRLAAAPDRYSLREAVLGLPENETPPPEETVVVFDIKTLTTTCADVRRALDLFGKKPDMPVISTEQPRDNPVQFRATYTVQDAGLLLLLETGETLARLRSRLQRPVAAASRRFLMPAAMAQTPPDGSRVVREQDGSARLVWEHAPCGEDVGVVVLSSRNLGMIRVCTGPVGTGDIGTDCIGTGGIGTGKMKTGTAGTRLLIDAPPESLLRLTPFCVEGISADRPSVFSTGDGQLVLPPSEEGVCGYLYVLENHVGTGTYAISEQHVPRHAEHPATVTGRQDFPDILRYDGGLCVGTRQQLLDLDDHMTSGKVRTVSCGCHESIRLETSLDILRYRVWQESMQNMSGDAS